jgi:hypothetical protein
VGLGFLWVTAPLLAIIHTAGAVRDPEIEGRRRVRAIASAPIAIALVLASKFGLSLGQRLEASAYLMFHRDEMMEAERRAAPGEAAEIKFVEGIPDGGLAIVRWHKEPIRNCRRIWPRAWLCHYN